MDFHNFSLIKGLDTIKTVIYVKIKSKHNIEGYTLGFHHILDGFQKLD